MSLPSSKELKKLADSCRKAGIKHFKNADIEFTLSDDAPVSNYKKTKNASKGSIATKNSDSSNGIDQNFQSDDLTEDQLLMWSSYSPAEGVVNEEV